MISPVPQGFLGRRTAPVVVAGVVVALTLAACSGSSKVSPGTASTSDAPAQAAGPRRGRPAASGTVAALSGRTMQVQDPQSGQVAVSWSASTKFNHAIATTLSSVRAGDCVTAVAPSGTSATAASFTATALTVASAVNGACFGDFRGPGNEQRPSGFPSGQRPSGFPSGRSTVGAVAAGKVTSVSGSTVVIAARQFGTDSSATTTRTVTVDAKTKITTDAATTATSVKVGKCVTAQGKADSSGAVTATAVRITDPVNGQCVIAFGGPSGGNDGG